MGRGDKMCPFRTCGPSFSKHVVEPHYCARHAVNDGDKTHRDSPCAQDGHSLVTAEGTLH